jgi:hypothetical protein
LRQAASRPLRRTLGAAMKSQLLAHRFSGPSRLVSGSWSACSSSVAADGSLSSSGAIAGAVSQPSVLHLLAERFAGVRPRRLRSGSERVEAAVHSRVVRQSCHSAAQGPRRRPPRHRPGMRISLQMQVKALFSGIAQCSSSRLASILPSCSRWCTCVAPNPFVKGTSCGRPQAAPYVER